MIIFIAEQAVVPDILPDLEKAVDSWQLSSQLKATKHSGGDSYHPGFSRSESYIRTP